MDQVYVSVFMLTYNQESYIAQAIEGVLMQRTDFSIQLVIGEDFSTDKTRKICQYYASKYPEKIKLLLNEKNLGLGANYVKTLAECKGKYIAICDGDDYWTDPIKLQKQVDFLKNHPDFKIVFTNNKNIYPSGKTDIRNANEIPKISSFHDLVKSNYIASVTVLFQNKPLSPNMQNLIKILPYGDWPTYLWVLKDGGKIKFLNDLTSIYRKDFGTSTDLRQEKGKIGKINLFILQQILYQREFQSKRLLITESIRSLKKGLMASYNKEGKLVKAFALFFNLLLYGNKKIVKTYVYSLKTGYFKK